jgi:membrane associated rhomboid family serine protease/Zn-finger nucleic acid-binding protein
MHVYVDKSGVHVDHCYRCGGSFLDFGKASHVVGEKADIQHWRREAFARPPYQSHLYCPSGHGPMWSYLLAWEGKQVEIDACGGCHGIWLDAREAELLHEITIAAHAEQARPGSSKGTLGVAAMYLVQLATSIPVEVHNPVKRKPVLVHALVALLTVIFVVEMALVERSGLGVLDAVAFVPQKFESGYFHTLITYAFLHGSIFHLLGNLYFLWIFGDNVEDVLGRGRFTVLYLVSAVVAGLAHWLGNLHSTETMVGASGAIAGLMGAYFVLFPRVKVWVVFLFVPFKLRAIWYLLIWVGMQFLLMLDPKSRVAWLAHVGGFVAGVALAGIMKPKVEALARAGG